MTPSDFRTDVSAGLDTAMARAVRHLKATHFKLAYLALLTREGIKPLSRWGSTLAERDVEALKQLGLQARQVPRVVRNSEPFTETVFSVTPAYLEIYASYFANRAVDQSAETVRIEGFLFGYPPCCVAQYIRQPYAPDEFPMRKRKILFHGACRGCIITPLLTDAYERIHRLTEML
jgi:hypothetical protein